MLPGHVVLTVIALLSAGLNLSTFAQGGVKFTSHSVGCDAVIETFRQCMHDDAKLPRTENGTTVPDAFGIRLCGCYLDYSQAFASDKSGACAVLLTDAYDILGLQLTFCKIQATHDCTPRLPCA